MGFKSAFMGGIVRLGPVVGVFGENGVQAAKTEFGCGVEDKDVIGGMEDTCCLFCYRHCLETHLTLLTAVTLLGSSLEPACLGCQFPIQSLPCCPGWFL